MILNARFKFNRPINKESDCISVGGFAVTARGEQYCFDFETYYGYVDKEDPTVIRYEGRNLDIETFPESKNLQDYALENIETLDECSIDTDDDRLYLTEVLDFSLCAERYLQIGWSVMTPNKNRYELLGRLIEEYKVDGVVEMTLQACHTYNVEAKSIEKFVKGKGVPYIHVETDYSQEDIGQLNTRMTAFVEML